MYLRPLIFILLLLASCKPYNVPERIEPYLPPLKLLEEGIACKYYQHSTPKEGFPVTDIRYDYLKLEEGNQLRVSIYNGAVQLVNERVFSLTDDEILLLSEKRFSLEDTIVVNVSSSAYLNFTRERSANLTIEASDGGDQNIWSMAKTLTKDTIVDGREALIFHEDFNVMNVSPMDTSRFSAKGKVILTKGLWITTSERTFSDMHHRTELIEQIPNDAFQKLINHDTKRVAYISAEKSISDDSHFTLCDHESKIHDYYNGGDLATHGSSKKQMIREIIARVDKQKLFKESGYLTYRFVVNCEGKAGRFVTEETSLDFQTKKFNAETVAHLLGVVKEFQDWKPVISRDQKRDAYFYLTFKLKDGEITDILP